MKMIKKYNLIKNQLLKSENVLFKSQLYKVSS